MEVMKCKLVISLISDIKKIGEEDLGVREEVYLRPYVN
jgi:hypothetical protein